MLHLKRPHWVNHAIQLGEEARAWWERALAGWRAHGLRDLIRSLGRYIWRLAVYVVLWVWHGLNHLGKIQVWTVVRGAALVLLAATVVLSMLLLMVVKISSTVPAHDPVDSIHYLDQGPDWGQSISAKYRQAYYYTPQGANIYELRYWWFVRLEQAWSSERFAEPQNMRALGFIVDDTYTSENPERLPVGFARRFDASLHEDLIDITCAACHTGELDVTQPGGRRVGIRIDGGQAMHAIKAMRFGHFGPTLLAAMAATWLNPIKFNRFAHNVLGTDYSAEGKSALSTAFRGVMWALLRQAVVDNGKGLYPVEEGFGRVDAVGRISNHLFGEELDSKNYHIGNAPVSFPPLWNIWKFDWVQYSAEVSQPLARNMGESLGTGATIALKDLYGRPLPEEQRYSSAALVNNLVDLEKLLTYLKPPTWPEDVLGPIDHKKADAGKVLFVKFCAGCHQPCQKSDFDVAVEMPLKLQPNGQTLPHWRINQFPVEDIGTDPQAALNFVNARIDLSRTGITVPEIQKFLKEAYAEKKRRIDNWNRDHKSPGSAPYATSPDMDGIDMRSLSIGSALSYIGILMREHYFAKNYTAPDVQAVMDGFGALDLPQVKLQYKARPLEGIWATPPFLHNGSVPTLYELLLPADLRRKTFLAGRFEFDPVRVGLYAQPLSRRGWWLDTSLPGNLNLGHEFRAGYQAWHPGSPPAHGIIGPELTDAERWAIVEYLKIHKDDPAPPCETPGAKPTAEPNTKATVSQIRSRISTQPLRDRRGSDPSRARKQAVLQPLKGCTKSGAAS